MDLLEMGFSASVIILVVIVCRFLFINNLPKKVFLVLWAVVLVRLLIPYSFPSILSIYSLAGKSQFISEKAESIVNMGKEKQEYKEDTREDNRNLEENENNIIKNNNGFSVWTLVWAAGFIVCMAAFIISYILCYKRFCTSLPVNNKFTEEWLKSHKTIRRLSIRQSRLVKSPLSYGILRPVVLMPETTDWGDLKRVPYILEHEFIHVKRFDAAAKLFLIIAVCVHWFNPLVWVMYILVNRDIELSCDETVVRHFGENSKAAYALVLVSMEEEKSGIVPFGSNFSKNAAEERITAIMKIKKNSLSIYIRACLLVAIVVSFFATSSAGTGKQKEMLPVKDETAGNGSMEENVNIPQEEVSGTYSNVLGEIAAGIAAKGDYSALRELASFVKQKDLDKIAKQVTEKGDYEAVIDLAPFLSEDVINEIAKYMADKEAYEALRNLAPFMQENKVKIGYWG